MSKDEIKKALELCSKDEDCEKCPYCATAGTSNRYFRCMCSLQKDALDLITEQEKEIEKKRQIIENLNGLIDYADKEIRKLKAEKKQAQVDTINTIVEYCENPNYWNELKDCKLWGGKSDDLRNFLNEIFKGVENEG